MKIGKKFHCSYIYILILLGPFSFAQQVESYIPISKEVIQVEASSEFPGFPAVETINGSGMENHSHISQNLGRTMWLSKISNLPVRARENTVEGVVWLLYKFDEVEKIDLLEIWNHNQDNHINRGLQKVYFQYSEDGKKWHTLKNSPETYHIIPKSGGRKNEPASFHLKLDGLRMKYFCITADSEKGNYYHDNSTKTLDEAKWENQNINYYGISEIRFYRKSRRSLKELPEVKDFNFTPTQAYLKTAKGPSREYLIEFEQPIFTGGKLEVTVGEKSAVANILPSKIGLYEYSSHLPSGFMEELDSVGVSFVSPQGNIKKRIEVPGARKWHVYFLPHSHLDIGYTHKHKEVMNLQLRNIDQAVELIEKTKNYPIGSRFKWNVEAMWPVQEYLLKFRGSPKLESFKSAVKNGSIGLSAALGSILTGISKQEEQTHYFDDAHKMEDSLVIEINSVMMSDIPGVSWGTVTSMAENGIKYFSMAPNYVPYLKTGGSRVGLSHIEWGDYPFYWHSQSGEERVLFWSAGKGYSFFHDWLGGRISSGGLKPIWNYLEELEKKEFPYNISYLRYTINGDNGPPDQEMSDVIKKWNETYEYPKFIIGTTEELFHRFEKIYGDKIPSFKGDFTPYWEDGAASTASELAMNRYNSERLNQLEILYSLIKDTNFPTERFSSAWRNVVLFSEHTWGASASGTDPEGEFTKILWKEKQAFARIADSISTDISEIFEGQIQGNKKGRYIHVFNTSLWPRSDVVKVSTSVDLHSSVIIDKEGNQIPVQKRSKNEWLFLAENISPMASAVFEIRPKKSEMDFPENNLKIIGNKISNGALSIVIDSVHGAIASLRDTRTGKNYASGRGLNDFIYTGRNASRPQYIHSLEEIVALHEGPVFATIRIRSKAPGTDGLTRDITLYRNINRIDIKNTLEKKNIYEHENVRFGFPFNITDSETIIDLPFSQMIPERDQLSGANKNFFSVNNGVTISGLKESILLTTIGTPILEVGGMDGEEWMKDSQNFLGWKRNTTSSSTVYSWVMNNSWGTNYKASQGGEVSFKYSIFPLKPYSGLSKQKSKEIAQPLIAVNTDNPHAFPSLFVVTGNNKISVSTIRPTKDKKGYLLRLVNLSNESVKSSFVWKALAPKFIYQSNNEEEVLEKWQENSFWMKPFGTMTLKLEM